MHKRFGVIGLALTLGACQPASYPDAPTISQDASLSASCSGCHIAGSAVPGLDDWTEPALAERLRFYQDATTGDSAMHRFARGLSDDDITQISAYLSKKS